MIIKHWIYWTLIVDGGWSAYGAWTECSASCGDGSQSRSRTCNNPSPAHGGLECSGQPTENRVCGTAKCRNSKCKTRKHYDRDRKMAIDVKIHIYIRIYSEC